MFFKKNVQKEEVEKIENKLMLSNEQAVYHFGDTVYRIALKMTKHEVDAQDIFQEVFMRYIKYSKGMESLEQAKHWFIRTTINCCKDFFEKKKKLFNEVEIEHAMLEADEKRDYSSVRDAVQDLDGKYRIVVHLFYFEQYKIKEIAEILNESEGTVKSKLKRARDLLKEKIQNDD